MSNKKKTVFRGVATALITPFSDGEIDYNALGRIIDHQLAAGIDGLVVAGTTGEASTLTYEERAELISFVAHEASGRVPVIAGCGSNNTRRAIELAKTAECSGADALLAVTPYYNKATPSGLIAHYTALADATDLPLILYNVPSRTGVNLSPAVCAELSKHPRIVGVKEASGNISTCATILSKCRDSFDLWSGNDDMILPVLSLGGSGVISVVSNLFPEKVISLCRAFGARENDKAASIQLGMSELIAALFSAVNPIPIKTAMAARGLCHEEFRLPLCPLGDKEKDALLEVVEKYASTL